MVSALNRCLILLLAAGLCRPSLAELLDDSLSPQQQHDLDLVWKYSGDTSTLSEREFNAVTASATRVDTRLDTARYVGSRVRIFLELPIVIRGLAAPSSLELSWTTGGLFSAGRVSPGNRQLIFEGTVTDPVMRDIFNFTFELDARHLLQTVHLEPVYEIEIISP